MSTNRWGTPRGTYATAPGPTGVRAPSTSSTAEPAVTT